MEPSWLRRKISVQDAELAYSVKHDRLGSEPVPFGFLNAEWKELLAKMRPGDELWEFSSSNESWQDMAGRAGISLVRDGEIIDSILTAMN